VTFFSFSARPFPLHMPLRFTLAIDSSPFESCGVVVVKVTLVGEILTMPT